MSKIDDLFRDGLGARKADVPNTNDLWNRVNAARSVPPPSGEALDQTFREGLRDRQAPVPAGMWARIAAARTRRPLTRWFAAAAALLLLLVAGGIGYKMTGSDPVNTTFVTTTVAHDAEVAEEVMVDENRTNENQRVNPPAKNDGPPALEVGSNSASSGVFPPAQNDNRTTGQPVNGTADELDRQMTGQPDNRTTRRPDPNTIAPLAQLAAVRRIEAPAEENLPEVSITPGKFRPTSALRGLQTELLFGVSYANQQLTSSVESADVLRELRANSEFPVAGYQITLRTSHRFNDRLRVLAGVTYAEIRNELDYNRIVNGQSVRLSTNNHIRMLEAPLLAGYTIPGRRMNVTVNAGPVINLTTSARGRFLDPDSALPLDLATEGNLRRNVGVGFMTSLTTAYQIGKNRPFTLLIEPFFKAYPTAFTVKDAPLRESYWVAGLQFGVRKSL